MRLTALLMLVLTAAARGDESLTAKLAAKMAELKVPGAVVRVERPGHPPLALALGTADFAANRPMTPDCHFRVASISKVFVGQAVLALVDDKAVSLDDPISKYVPGVPNGDAITLRHLGTHRSGLFNHIRSADVKAAFAKDPVKAWSDDEILAFSLKQPVAFSPGEKHDYSNANTVLLAKVVEKVTGKPWADAVRSRVIGPLGLKRTTVPADNRMPEPFARGYAYGAEAGPFFKRGEVRHDVTLTSPTWWGPAGCLISTADDLAVAAKAFATGQLLKSAGKAELFRWTPADQAGFEYGFHVEKFPGGAVGHDGDVPGYQCFAAHHPELGATVVVLTNVYGWSIRDMPADRIAMLLMEEVFGLKVPQQPKP